MYNVNIRGSLVSCNQDDEPWHCRAIGASLGAVLYRMVGCIRHAHVAVKCISPMARWWKICFLFVFYHSTKLFV